MIPTSFHPNSLTPASLNRLTALLKSCLAAITLLALGPAPPCQGQELKATAGAEVLLGESPGLAVTGLKPKERVTLHSYRAASASPRVLAHAYAEFEADSRGLVQVDTTPPIKGTYQGADPLGLLWSGEKMAWIDIGIKTSRSVVISLERGGVTVAASLTLQLTDGQDRVDVQDVAEAGLNGAFAKPKNATAPIPTIILLHGSNGGSTSEARAPAIRFAQLGYAAFSLNYFSWTGLGGLPRALVNIPIENLTAARAWLSRQPGVTTDQVSVWGVSKGAEYALVAAANLPWIHRVIACVPSSVVWSGFGRPPIPGELFSSWTVKGRSLPFIPYDNYDDVLSGRLSAGAVHRRSLAKLSNADRQAARIPLENTGARILLLGATRDHVWPSGDMTRDIAATLRAAGKGEQLTARVFEDASHFICGTGEELQRITPVVNPEGGNPSPEATARAAAQAWAETKRFLAR